STTVTLTTTGPPDFTIAATPATVTTVPGNSASYTITVGAVSGFRGRVSLSATGLPANAATVFNPASVVGAGSSTLTVTTAGTTPTGTSTITIGGTSGS